MLNLPPFQVRVLFLPKYSPELNPIEYVIGLLKRDLRSRNVLRRPIAVEVFESAARKVSFELVAAEYWHCIANLGNGQRNPNRQRLRNEDP
jgi:transposase